MTRVFDIPQGQWILFIRMLNGFVAGRPVHLEVIERKLEEQQMRDRQPLREMDLNHDGLHCRDLAISVGDDTSPLTHRIQRPTRLALGLDEVAVPQWLGIREAGGGTTIIYFEQLTAIEADYRPF